MISPERSHSRREDVPLHELFDRLLPLTEQSNGIEVGGAPMHQWIRKRYHLLSADGIQADGVVIRRECLSAVLEAESIISDAHERARLIVEAAHEQARSIVEVAHDRSEAIELDRAAAVERDVWRRAISMLDVLGELQARFHAGLDARMVRVFAALVERLRIELAARERLMSVVSVVLNEADDVAGATLMVSKADWELAADELTASLGCAVEVDSSLGPGECRLCGGQGESRASFDGSIETLLSALGDAHAEPSACGDGMD